MININSITLQGRLIREPTMRSGNGNSMAFFTLAANYRYRDDANNLHEDVAFVPCKCFGRWTEELAGRRKGEMAIVTGRLRTEGWGEGDERQPKLVLKCDSVQFVIPASRNGSRSESKAESAFDNGEPPTDRMRGDPKLPPF